MAVIKYPVGIQTFSEIITKGYLYVDKTAIIHDLLTTSKYVFLSRPRRFGKSLLTSTLEAYFKGRRELFAGLAMANLEKDWESYPVFRFDLSVGRIQTPHELMSNIERQIGSFDKEYGLHTHGSYDLRFRQLIMDAFAKTGRQVVILIDEYDKPMLDLLDDEEKLNEMKTTLRGFYSVIKASDEFIKFAMLTGITKFGQVSIFSGINNLRDISMIPKYNGICGITEAEFHHYFKDSIARFAEENSMSSDQAWQSFKILYDGYHFADTDEYVYNPYSVLNCFNDGRFDSYWYKSGTPNFLDKLLNRRPYHLNNLEGAVRNEMELSDITDLSYDIVPLLYQTGYLTIKRTLPTVGFDPLREYELGFPNMEVTKAFWNSLATRFFRGFDGRSAFNLNKCVKEINEGRPDDFMLGMKSLFADTNSETEKNKEIHFQNMMAIVCKMLGFAVRTEVHSAKGRCDMQIQTPDFVYIFEFKVDGTPEEALDQIYGKGYALPFEADPRTVFLIGADFSTETRTLTDWIIRKQ